MNNELRNHMKILVTGVAGFISWRKKQKDLSNGCEYEKP